jgi:biotin synthase
MTALSKDEILHWLREDNPARLAELFRQADAVRRAHVGDAVHLRGLVEVSNHCVRQCMYCGLRAANRTLTRYRMSDEEIRNCARMAVLLGYGTVVLQAGEDAALTSEWVAETIHWIKQNTALAVTLSLGERTPEELRQWRNAGADRYLLRFETSDASLFDAIHPRRTSSDPRRTETLPLLKKFGYEAGGGVMVGIPGQSYESLANDVLAFRNLDLDMIGIGPYIAHPATPLGNGTLRPEIAENEQAPASEEMVYKMVALARIACPDANIPATTALATLNRTDGRRQGLRVGANVVMPNLTPREYRSHYQIYPGKACVEETAEECNRCLNGQIHSIGRVAGSGAGGRGIFPLQAVNSLHQSALVQLHGGQHER